MLKTQLIKIVLSEGQGPDIVINEANHLRNELVYIGEMFNDGGILDIVL